MSEYNVEHERLNVATHLVGVAFGLIGFPILVARFVLTSEIPWWMAVGAALYGLTFLMVFSFSSLYHAEKSEKKKVLFKIWDHVSIYFLIAGSYTPFLLMYSEGSDAYWMLAVMWGLALVGTVFKLFYTGRFRVVSTGIYLAMGWLIVFAPESFKANMPDVQILWIAIGGGFYTLGVLFYLVKRIPYHHAIWHVFVLAGAIAHFIAVWKMT